MYWNSGLKPIIINIVGRKDATKCFYCGEIIYDWEPTDNPWEEHAKLFPHCGFLKKRSKKI